MYFDKTIISNHSKVSKEITRECCVVLDEERIENLTSVFPLHYLSMFEQFSKYKK